MIGLMACLGACTNQLRAYTAHLGGRLHLCEYHCHRSAIIGPSAQIDRRRAAWIVWTQRAGSPGVNVVYVTKRETALGETIGDQAPGAIHSRRSCLVCGRRYLYTKRVVRGLEAFLSFIVFFLAKEIANL